MGNRKVYGEGEFMKLSSLVKTMLAASVASTLVACGGGGGGSGSTSRGGVYFTHEELAQEFVYRMNVDLGYDVSLAKTNTRQRNYIVVYDYDTGSYDAYDLSGYNVGEDIGWFIDRNEGDIFYDLDYVGGNVYEDYWTGIQFSKTGMSELDMSKASALVDDLKKRKAKEVLTVEFNLSPERADEVAGLAVELNNMDKSNLTTSEYDAFAEAVVGKSFTELKNAMQSYQNGSADALESSFQAAAQKNKISLEHARKLAMSLIGN